MKGDHQICGYCCSEFLNSGGRHFYCSATCSSRAGSFSCREFPTRTRFTIFDRDKFKCFYCGASPMDDKTKLVVDHVIPFSRGGETTTTNMVTCCYECNRSKGCSEHNPEALAEIQAEIVRRNLAYLAPKRSNYEIAQVLKAFRKLGKDNHSCNTL